MIGDGLSPSIGELRSKMGWIGFEMWTPMSRNGNGSTSRNALSCDAETRTGYEWWIVVRCNGLNWLRDVPRYALNCNVFEVCSVTNCPGFERCSAMLWIALYWPDLFNRFKGSFLSWGRDNLCRKGNLSPTRQILTIRG